MPGFILGLTLFTSWVGPGRAKPSLVAAGGDR
jgi:glycosyltransferase A (GT-A) superfamily protein (DUF2064 family)